MKLGLLDLSRPHEVLLTLDAADSATRVATYGMHAVVVQVEGSTEQRVIEFPTFFTPLHQANTGSAITPIPGSSG